MEARTDPATTGAVRLRSLARPLAALTALNVALLLVWSVMVPTFRGADEHVHHDFVRYLTGTWSYPEFDGLAVSRRTLAALGVSPVIPAHAPPAPAAAAPPRAERPGWADLGPDVRDGPPNQMPQHPPLYYESAGAALRVLDGDGALPLDLAVWLLRLLNLITMAPLPWLAADIARRYTRSIPTVLTAATGVLAVPQLTHVGATVSNDPLMILFGSLTLAGAARLATGDRRWWVAVGTGVAAGLGLFTKGFAVPLVPAVALACVLPPTRRHAWGTLARAAGVAVIAFVLGGWWWIRNVLEYQTPQPGVRLRSKVPDVELDLARFAGDFTERLLGSFWGNFGWREAHLPIGISYAMTAAVVVLVGVACWRAWSRVMLALPALAAAAMVLSSGWGAFKKTGVSYATQGRYLFAGIVGVSVLVALGVTRVLPRGGRRAPLVGVAVALTLQGVGLVICAHRYWGGAGIERIRALIRFSPLPGPVTAGFWLLLAVAALAALWSLWAVDRTESSPAHPTSRDE